MEKKNEKKGKIKIIPGTQLLYVIGGVVSLGAGIGFGFLWFQSQNVVLALLTILPIGLGILLIIKSFQTGDEGIILTPEGSVATGIANSLNIYAKTDPEAEGKIPEKIAFETMLKPEGHPQRCRNDNKYYYVHILDIKKGKLVPFKLPDAKFCPPTQLRISATMQANQAYFQPIPNLFQKVAPWLLVVVIVVLVLLGLPLSSGG